MTTENYMYRSNKEEFFQYHDVIKQVGRYEIYHKLIFKKEKWASVVAIFIHKKECSWLTGLVS